MKQFSIGKNIYLNTLQCNLVDTREIKEAPDSLGCEQRKGLWKRKIQVAQNITFLSKYHLKIELTVLMNRENFTKENMFKVANRI